VRRACVHLAEGGRKPSPPFSPIGNRALARRGRSEFFRRWSRHTAALDPVSTISGKVSDGHWDQAHFQHRDGATDLAEVDAPKYEWPDFAEIRRLAMRVQAFFEARKLASLGAWIMQAISQGNSIWRHNDPVHDARRWTELKRTGGVSICEECDGLLWCVS